MSNRAFFSKCYGSLKGFEVRFVSVLLFIFRELHFSLSTTVMLFLSRYFQLQILTFNYAIKKKF